MENGGQIQGEPPKMRANRKALETNCSICKGGFQLAEEVYQCPSCAGYHHIACWDEAGRCPRPSVVNQTSPVTDGTATSPANQTYNGTNPLTGGQVQSELSCPQCGRANPPAALSCECGHTFELASPRAQTGQGPAPDERRCPSCAEMIKKQALKCRFCGHVLDSRLAEPGTDSSTANPPGLHWLLVLLLCLVTCGLFAFVWIFRQAYWAKKADSSSKALLYYILYFVVILIAEVLSANKDMEGLGGIFNIGSIVLFQMGNFSIKGTIESHYNTSLSGVMTFFFGVIYFQYHFNQIAKGRDNQLSILST